MTLSLAARQCYIRLLTVIFIIVLVVFVLIGLVGFLANQSNDENFLSYNSSGGDDSAILFPDGTRLCPRQSPFLTGTVKVDLDVPNLAHLELANKHHLEAGGRHKPVGCRARSKAAIIVALPPAQNHHPLPVFLNHMHPFLQRQQLSYGIFVVEQSRKNNSSSFNRGKLMNIGFMEALGSKEFYQCVILHDIGLLPEDDRNVYSCPENGKPRLMAIALSTFEYRPMRRGYFGGVVAISTSDFVRLNGFSNSFSGWTGEDENLYRRAVDQGMTVVRYPENLARYTAQWTNRTGHVSRLALLNDTDPRLSQFDGLIDLTYKELSIDRDLLYTRILVEF